MKPTKFFAVLIGVCALSTAHALDWDTVPGNSTANGGSGLWDLTTPNWFNGTTNVPWNSGSAVFGGTDGQNVTISVPSGGIQASALTLSTFMLIAGDTSDGDLTDDTLIPIGMIPVTGSPGLVRIDAVIAGTGGLNFQTGGLGVTLNAANTYSGGTEIRLGQSIEIVAGNLMAFGTGDVSLFSGTANFKSTLPTGTVGNNFIFAGSGIIRLGPVDSLTGNILVQGSGMLVGGNRLTISGIIDGSPNGTLGVGFDTTLTANSPFPGTLNIGGDTTLTLAPGSGLPNARIRLSGSNQHQAKLAGTGTVGPVDVLGVECFISPGGDGGIGTLTIGGFRDLLTGAGGYPGGDFRFDIGATADQIALNGTMSLNETARVSLNLAPGFAPTVGDILYLITNDGVDVFSDRTTGSPVFFSSYPEGRIFSFGGAFLQSTYFADSATGSFTGGNDFAVKVIPEPSLGCLLAIGLGTTLIRRRRSNWAQ